MFKKRKVYCKGCMYCPINSATFCTHKDNCTFCDTPYSQVCSYGYIEKLNEFNDCRLFKKKRRQDR